MPSQMQGVNKRRFVSYKDGALQPMIENHKPMIVV